MPFCPKCGKEVSSEADYCYYCGQSLSKGKIPLEPKSVALQPATPSTPQPTPTEPVSHKNRNIAIAIVIFAVVFFGTFYILGNPSFYTSPPSMVTVTGSITTPIEQDGQSGTITGQQGFTWYLPSYPTKITFTNENFQTYTYTFTGGSSTDSYSILLPNYHQYTVTITWACGSSSGTLSGGTLSVQSSGSKMVWNWPG